MKYFEDFVPALSATDLAPVEDRAYATEGPALTFGHLDDRAFEILTYRLMSKRGATTMDRVTLMQGVGERPAFERSRSEPHVSSGTIERVVSRGDPMSPLKSA